uniref:Orotidine 5'-phosphate decarboxylase n=1 Tax=Myrothecium gramineum TaxID=226117 RepID=Q2HZ31_9HYPO|nr:orotidine 5'-monophosphate decarboxylase [Myrothecium gramineum]
MSSKSGLPYHIRATTNPHPVARKLFAVAERKKSNLIISADLTDTKSLLECADELGPFISVFKTHIDIIHDFGDETVRGLKSLARKHDFLIFEDRKFVDIGSTAQKQYHGGALRISEWADIVNVSLLGGDGVVNALGQVITDETFPYRGQRALLLLAEMTTAGSLAVEKYTERCVAVARKNGIAAGVMGFVATRGLEDVGNEPGVERDEDEDFVVFTTGINSSQSDNVLGQKYQTPEAAIRGGSDFIIAGRGIYASEDRVQAAKQYQAEGWAAYVARIGPGHY